MGDKQIQKTFVDKVTDLKNPLKKEKRPIELYKDLVHHAVFEHLLRSVHNGKCF